MAKAPNLEQTISKVMRRIQGTPIIFSMVIKEAFFRILLHEDSVNSLLFLMDFDTNSQTLTGKQGPNTKLVTIRCLVTVMGMLQSPCYLSKKGHYRQGVAYFLKYFSYLDDLQAGITGEELAALQQSVNLEENIDGCEDTNCCPTDSVEPVKEALGPTTPEDELRGCIHLMQGPFGQQLWMVLRAARLELALKRASMPSKGARTSLEAQFSKSSVNASILKYTTVLSEGKEPNFQMLLNLPPPEG